MRPRHPPYRTFDASADGYGRGEGFAVLVLAPFGDVGERRVDALGVVTSSAVNQDGRSSSLTAPNGPSQSRLVASALRFGRVDASELKYVALHGTGAFSCPRILPMRGSGCNWRLEPSVLLLLQALRSAIQLRSALSRKRFHGCNKRIDRWHSAP